MRSLRLCALAALSLAACTTETHNPPPGTNVDVHLVFDDSVTDEVLATVDKLAIHETSGKFDQDVAIAPRKIKRAGEFFRYKPLGTGKFALQITALASDAPVAQGKSVPDIVPVDGKTIDVTITLSASGGGGDGGVDGMVGPGPETGAEAPDAMMMPDGATPDGVDTPASDNPAADGVDAADSAADVLELKPETPAQANGATCGDGSECQSGFCVDGVCCNTACAGTCRTCSDTSSMGTCILAQSGTDPRDSCADEGMASCGKTGVCDSLGNCALYPRGAVCAAQACANDASGVGVVTLPAVCDGQGNCGTTLQMKRSCAPYACDATTKDCRTGCTGSAPPADGCAMGVACSGGSCGKKPIGVTCGMGTECQSGVCSEGICCNTDCSGGCQTCKLPESFGTCVPVPAGDDPKDFCSSEAPASPCGRDGQCDGSGACRKAVAGTHCQDASCSGGILAQEGVCDGSGVCKPGATLSCGAYNCNATATGCLSSCSAGADCTSGICTAGSCGKLPLGADCSDGTRCASGKCVDGVCCNGSCTNTCEACNLPGSKGQCKKIPDGQDPNAECAADDPSSCGNSGFCDGAGACSKYAAGTICLNQVCSGHGLQSAATCDGAGTCGTPSSIDCDPFTCDAAGAGCRLSCSGDTQCVSPNLCVGGSCGKKPPGAPCVDATECKSGFCAPAPDNVCCDVACDGLCVSCKLPGSIGQCKPIAAGQMAEGSDCPADPVAGCGKSGLCDGAGACAKYDNTVECGTPACSGSTLTAAAKCNGGGMCITGSQSSCGAYSCATAGSSCNVSCLSGADCSTGYYCDTTVGQCLLKKLGSVACGGAGECATGFCEQGVCCNRACAGDCESCNLTGTVGTCSNAPAGMDPKDKCADAGATSCGQDGMCDGSGACRKYAIGTVCNPATCSDITFTPASTCNGTGTCVPASAQNCTPYKCGAAGCLSMCTTIADCATGVPACTAGSCGKKPLGATCSGDADCNSAHCIDGVCCATTCTGLCVSCNVSGSAGTCSPIPVATDPDSECATDACHDGSCNGAGACTVTVGAVCGATTCSGSSTTSTPICAASGACTGSMPGSCARYVCAANACKTTCAGNGDCSTGNYCLAGTCVPTEANGTACTADAQCTSGACSDSVCCNASCNGPCQSCALSGTVGTCISHLAGTDPENACTMTNPGFACNGSGACNTTCTTAAQCEAGYYCAASACQPKKPLGQSCGAAGECTSGNCVDGTCCGTASCGGTQTCANPEGVCKSKLGQPCASASECTYSTSPFCVDGTCCNSGCAGVCYSCKNSTGTCKAISAGTDPDQECFEGYACNGAGNCAAAPCLSATDCEAGSYACMAGDCAALASFIPPGKLFPMQFTGGGYNPADNSNRSSGASTISGHPNITLSLTVGDPSPICARNLMSDPDCKGPMYEVVFGFESTTTSP